jgi:lipoprotein-anchoring transpeptidase ErfK/SrfK
MTTQNRKNNTRLYLSLGVLGVLMCAVFGVAAWTAVNHPAFASILPQSPAPVPTQENLWAQVEIVKPLTNSIDVSALMQQAASMPTPQPLLEAPSASTDVPTDAPTPIPTDTLVPTPEATETPAQLAMEIVPPTPTSAYIPPTRSPNQVYASSGNGARWIDVDLSNQMVYAYEGDVLVNSFLVSTGTWATPTVTGQYTIYVKYRSAKMSGPGYYLPNVPYIMYFYKGYGLHGTYWHNNFGTPMSHGCVNLRTEDAGWLYNWASVGTVVNVHY